MENIAFDNNFITIYSDKEQSMVKQIYKDYDSYEDVTLEDFQEFMYVLAHIVEEDKLTKNLVDGRHAKIAITPEMQTWAAEVISPRLANLQKIAFVMSEDIFTHVSNNQLLNEDGIKDKYTVKRFKSIEEAKEWLDVSS